MIGMQVTLEHLEESCNPRDSFLELQQLSLSHPRQPRPKIRQRLIFLFPPQNITFNHDPGTSDDSGRASERLTTSSVAQRDQDSSRDRLSDVSVTHLYSSFLHPHVIIYHNIRKRAETENHHVSFIIFLLSLLFAGPFSLSVPARTVFTSPTRAGKQSM
jgi:hypothetical protein